MPRGGAALPDFPIIDAHVHLFDPANLPYAWLGGRTGDRQGAPSRRLRPSDRAGEGGRNRLRRGRCRRSAAPRRGALGSRHSAASEPRLRALVAGMPLEQGPSIEPDIAEYAKLPRARGVRRLIQKYADQPGWCLRPDFVAAVKLLPKYDLSFDICIFHTQMADAIELVRQCPEVSFILDHIGKPGIREGLTQPWRSQMRELAELPNVICKISGVVTEADHKRLDLRSGRALHRPFDRDVRLRSRRLRRRLAGVGAGDALCELGRRRRPGDDGGERRRSCASSTATTPSASIGL